jgi:hypothetical protein
MGCDERFGGCGDGLIGENGGLEIKCQYKGGRDPVVYIDYKLQAVSYMFLYKRQWWDIMVCSINHDDGVEVIVERIYWSNYEDKWTKEWYDEIKQFCQSVHWADKVRSSEL